MFSCEKKEKIQDYCEEIKRRFLDKHIFTLDEEVGQMLMISSTYKGVWLEHAYDAVICAKLYPEYAHIAKNTIFAFIKYQRQDGQLPFVLSKSREGDVGSYRQLQEVVSFLKIAFEVYEMTGDKELLKKSYEAGKKWDAWLRANRMTSGRGLVEMFVGFDTGHDSSARLNGMSCPRNNGKNEACVLPKEDGVTPILAVDINANFYATEKTLAKIALLLGKAEEGRQWEQSAKEIKKKLFEYCFDEEDCFFYDVDKYNNKRKYLSCTLFHLFSEEVLNREEDGELIERLYSRHIKNPKEFWTAYPFPSMAVSDPSFVKPKESNCWGYYSQALTALRCTLWMDKYGWGKDFDVLCEKWLTAWTDCYENMKFGQELDPLTGEPSNTSEWYSSCMLFYVYSARRLHLV